MNDWKDQLASMMADASMPTAKETNDTLPSEDKTEGNDKKWKRLKLNFFYEKKGRAGKPATIITGFDEMPDAEVASIASRLKQRLGCGGSARGGEILLQGDRRETAKRLLEALGFRC